MEPSAIVTRLSRERGRAPGTDAERRAAVALAGELRGLGYAPRTETLWVRPRDGLTLAVHALLGVAASVVSVDAPLVGAALAGAALLLALGELTGVVPLVRLLTPRRATQNVIAADPRRGAGDAPVRLILTAALDVPSSGALARGWIARRWSRARLALRGHLSGPHALLAASLLAVAGFAAARVTGVEGTALGAAQLAPTVALLLLFAAWVDLWLAPPARGDVDATGPAVALAVAEALRHRPPRRLAVDVVLAGAGAGPAQGMRAFVRSRRKLLPAEEVAVVHLEPCAAGRVRWWAREGRLGTLAFHPRLRDLSAAVAGAEGHLGAAAHVSRGFSGALAARRARWPAIAIGCLDEHGMPGREVDARAVQAGVEFALALVARVDADLGRAAGREG